MDRPIRAGRRLSRPRAVHVAIEDASRIAFSQIRPDETRESAVAFLQAALAYHVSPGIRIERVMADNGSCDKSFAFREACKSHRLKHIRTRPYTAKTNGKAERFIQTALHEWTTRTPTPTPISAPTRCHFGSAATTGIAHTAD